MLRGPGDTAVYRLAHLLIPPVFTRLYRMEITGVEHVPRSGAVVLASNHLSNIDPLFVGVACNRQVHFMAKSELWKFKPLGWLVEALGSFPVRRGAADREAVRRALELLDQERVVGIFPEGHRQTSGVLGEPLPGVALFSMRPGVTTIPMILRDTNRVVVGRRPAFPRVTVAFGPPVSAEIADESSGSRAGRHKEFMTRLMAALQALLDQTAPNGTRKGLPGHEPELGRSPDERGRGT